MSKSHGHRPEEEQPRVVDFQLVRENGANPEIVGEVTFLHHSYGLRGWRTKDLQDHHFAMRDGKLIVARMEPRTS